MVVNIYFFEAQQPAWPLNYRHTCLTGTHRVGEALIREIAMRLNGTKLGREREILRHA